jgi:hypothetical protein
MEMAMFDVHAGIALAGVLPGPTRVLARPVDGGYLFNGKAPWASGWGMIDVIGVAAYHEGSVHILMIDAVAGDTLQVQPLDLTAVQASATVRNWKLPAPRCSQPAKPPRPTRGREPPNWQYVPPPRWPHTPAAVPRYVAASPNVRYGRRRSCWSSDPGHGSNRLSWPT